ncbi:MAG: PhzF family phenazine biosynthesis protein [Polyangiaceae bacterium]
MKTHRYVVCDVFTERPLEGNQLAVFTNAGALDGDTMQALAREMAFSETVFILPPEQGGHAKLRIFTPAREIPFAGHPVLGTAFVVGGPLTMDSIRLETGMGVVPVELTREGGRVVFGWMQQPLPQITPFAEPEALFRALGVGGSGLAVETYDNGVTHTYVELASREAVASLAPDFAALARLPSLGVSAFAGSGDSFKTRMFAPAGGVPEDPATGSAAGPLAVHLARHGRSEYGREIRIEQGAELGRPSVLHARVFGSVDALERVEVGGSAVIVARGEFRF